MFSVAGLLSVEHTKGPCMSASVRERTVGKRDTLLSYQESLHKREEEELQYSDLE